MPRIFRHLFANIWLKLGSLAVAIIIWYSLTSQGYADKTYVNVPYEFRNIPFNYEVIDRGVGYVSVTARGPQNLIVYLKSENLTIPIYLPDDISAGEFTFPIKPSDVHTPYPNQITILQVLPSETTIRLDTIGSKKVKIQPFLRGSTATGFDIESWTVDPDEAEIRGPVSQLEDLDKIFTEPIDISGVSMNFNERVEILPQENFIHVVEPLRVTVRIEIKEKIIDQSFPEFELTVLKPDSDPGITIKPNVVTVNISGPYRILKNLQPQDFRVIADCRELEPGTYNIPLILVQAPAEIVSHSIDPPAVEVIVPAFPEQEKPSPESSHTPRHSAGK
jgi:hypothetical protein